MNEVNVAGTNCFELQVNQSTAFIELDKIDPNILDLIHTKVPDELSEQGVGSKLVAGALQYCKDNELKIIPSCEFVKSYIEKHSEWKDLISNK